MICWYNILLPESTLFSPDFVHPIINNYFHHVNFDAMKTLPHHHVFARHLFRNLLAALAVLVFSLGIGICGYCYFFHLEFIDGFYNACMILTGMGPINEAPSNAAKLFAGCYAVYSGVAFLTCVAVILGPLVHRFLHQFHLDLEE
jgi:hypothetical protein